MGTHASSIVAADNEFIESEPNSILIVEVRLPHQNTPLTDMSQCENSGTELTGYAALTSRVEVIQKINHPGEVNRARWMPQNTNIVASKAANAQILIFNITNYPLMPRDDQITSDMILKGQTKEGYGLSWNKIFEGQLLSSSEDGTVRRWDVNSGNSMPVSLHTAHNDVVEDVSWHSLHEAYFGTVGDDGNLMLWDIRENSPVCVIQAHNEPVNCISFNPFSEWIVATGSKDKTVCLWDLRQYNSKLHSLNHHSQEIYQVHWSPFNPVLLGSCGADRRLLVWDVSMIGAAQSPQEKEEGPPELIFIHGGHTDKISDFSWNLNDFFVCASVSEDNILQIWQMADTLYPNHNDEE